MQTIKTALVVFMLAAMFYGVYTVVNAPPPRAPKEVVESATDMSPPLRVEEGDGGLSPATASAMGQPGDMVDAGTAASPVPDGAFARSPSFPPSSSFRPTDRLDDRGGLSESPDPPTPAPPAPTPPAFTEGPSRTGPAPPLNQAPHDASVGSDYSPVPSEDLAERAPTPSDHGRSTFVPPNTTRAAVAEAAGSELSPVPADDDGALRPAPAGVIAAGAAAAISSAAPTDRTNSPVPSDSTASAAATGPERDLAPPTSYADGVRFDTKEAVFARGWRDAQHDLEQGHLRQALLTLSQVYEDPRLTAEDRVKLLETLDPLAGDVIYSTRHLLEPAYEIRRGDTLETVAEQLNVPWQLLQNINGVKNPNFLVPGEKLKVVRGPFRADVDLERSELTLFLNKYYAGRFPITVGNDPPPAPGEFEVKSKQPGRTYFSADGRNVPSGHPDNPFGRVWLDLGKNVAIHGSAEKADVAVNAGCISLSPRDAQDVFAILSAGSRVTIRR